MQEDISGNQYTVRDETSLREILLGIRTLWRYLLEKWKVIALIALVCGAIGFLYAATRKPIYQGQLTFVLENNSSSGMSGYSSIAAQFGLNIGGGSGGVFQGDDNIVALITSRKMVTWTLLTRDESLPGSPLLIDRYIDFNGLREKWKGNKRLEAVRFGEDGEKRGFIQDSLLGIFYKHIREDYLSVGKTDKKTDIIAVSVLSPDELFAKSFAEKLLVNVATFYVETQTKKSQENVAILRYQVDSVRNVMNAALSGAAISADANPNPNPAFQRIRVPSQRRMVDVEMSKAILEELVKHLELAEITLRKETPLVQIIDEPVLPLQKQKLGRIKGTIIGIMLGTFFIIVFLVGKRFLKSILDTRGSKS